MYGTLKSSQVFTFGEFHALPGQALARTKDGQPQEGRLVAFVTNGCLGLSCSWLFLGASGASFTRTAMGKFKVAMLLAFLLGFCAIFLRASVSNVVFIESFDEPLEGRWVASSKEDFQGKWTREKSEGHDDYGLFVSEKARKYAIAAELPKVVSLEDGTIVLQYDLRLQQGLECGGAYLKFLVPQEEGWTLNQFDNESPYSIMFGPDKCGATNKVHFIFRHKHPKTGKFVEHHLKYPPTPPSDKLTHVYTAVIHPNSTLKILVDGVQEKSADMLSKDFDPPVVPAKTIPDPEDKKPEDWDDRARVPDPEAVKPEDWDEDAPMEIQDPDAVKPDGWLDDEPDEIDDPEAAKPEDWDDEEDGEWEPPKSSNPKCQEAPGCGEWKIPMKRNPAYKGKWYPPMIDNPNYKGLWAPRDIPNPEYFELGKADLLPIDAVGIEIWTMQDGILFDNIVVSLDEAAAKEIRDKTWKVKYEVEKKKVKLEDDKEASAKEWIQGKVFEILYRMTDVPLLAPYRPRLIELIQKGEEHPKVTLGILAAMLITSFGLFTKLLCGGKKAPKTVSLEKSKKEDITPADDRPMAEKPEETEKEVTDERQEEQNTRRRTRRET